MVLCILRCMFLSVCDECMLTLCSCDIEQEVNGVYTPDRKEKLDATEVKKVVERVMEKYAQMHK